MTDLDQDTFHVELEGVGEYRGIFQQYSLSSNYMTPTDAWSFVVYSEVDQFELRRRWRPLQPIKLYINGQCQVIGRIDSIEGTGDGSAALRVSGRDYLADLVDATIDPQYQVTQGMTITDALLGAFRPFGITGLLADNGLNRNILTGKAPFARPPARDFRAATLADFKAEENQGVFEFASKIVARHGFLILPAGTRDTAIVDSPNYSQSPLYRLDRPGNLLSAVARRDFSNVPTVTIARGRGGDPNAKAGGGRSQYPTFGSGAPGNLGNNEELQRTLQSDDGLERIIEQRYDPKVGGVPLSGTLYRPLFFRDKDSRNQEQLAAAVRRMISERLRDTLTYEVTMRGHTDPDTGAVYAVDTIAEVSDTIEDIHENLWCYERDFSNDGSGPKTTLRFIRPESYVL